MYFFLYENMVGKVLGFDHMYENNFFFKKGKLI
jgi:hypothetical protein